MQNPENNETTAGLQTQEINARVFNVVNAGKDYKLKCRTPDGSIKVYRLPVDKLLSPAIFCRKKEMSQHQDPNALLGRDFIFAVAGDEIYGMRLNTPEPTQREEPALMVFG